MDEIKTGRYRHFKGHEYTVLGMARHSETLEKFVLYRQEYGDRGLWVRPEHMFHEQVTVDGQVMPRFERTASKGFIETTAVQNLFAELPAQLPKEFVQTLLSTADFRIERIISHGHASPEGFWYDQGQHEWVVVLTGEARLMFEHGTVLMKPGDFLNIPAFQKHRVDWTTPNEPTVWLGVRYVDDLLMAEPNRETQEPGNPH